jgi:hypothetical protein
MPLQIRRGTELQRQAMTAPLASGELLYVTDDQRLYVGNGTTLGGVQITGYTNEDAVDAVGAALINGVHSGITFTYGTTQDTAGRIDATIDLSDYPGTLKADAISATIVADDSTVLVDAVAGRIVGPVFSNVVGNLTGNVTGNVTGNINGVVTGTAGSSLIGTVTGDLTGNTFGTHLGDVKGSVFGDDSSIIVDAVDRKLIINTLVVTDQLGGVHQNIITGNGTSLFLGQRSSPTSVEFNLDTTQAGLFANGITTGPAASQPTFRFASSRGSLTNPSLVNDGDGIGLIKFTAWTGYSGSITGHADAGFIAAIVDDASITTGNQYVDVILALGLSSDSATDDLVFITKGGALSAPLIGYRPGMGATITQGSGSGKATAVTLNNVCGEITTDGATLNNATTVTFTLTNNKITAEDHLLITHVSGGTLGAYVVGGVVTGTGAATIYIRNVDTAPLNEALVLKYTVFASATS